MRYKCKWCHGTGVVQSGQSCRSCSGRGWYERPASLSKPALISASFAIALGIVFWILRKGNRTDFIFEGLSVSCLGVVILSLAIELRGSEEEGWDWLMLIGNLLLIAGILSIPIRAFWGL